MNIYNYALTFSGKNCIIEIIIEKMIFLSLLFPDVGQDMPGEDIPLSLKGLIAGSLAKQGDKDLKIRGEQLILDISDREAQ
jgi:hypothetical protein